MEYLFYYTWSDIRIQNIYDEIEIFKPKKIIFFIAEEYSLFLFFYNNSKEIRILEKYILKYDIKLIIIYGSKPYDNFYHNPDLFPIISNVELVFWPMFWLYNTNYQINRNDRAKYFYNNFNNKLSIDKLFISLNGRTQTHRCQLMDELFHYKLNENGYLSWIKIDNCSYDFNWKYWNPKKLELDDYDSPTGDQIASTPIEYKKVLFSLIPETTIDVPFITEKTFKAILFEEAFIILGAKNVHKLLVDHGFELYDEIFDYSFDEIEEEEYRIDGIIGNLLRLKNKNYNELREIIKPKIKRNRDHALEIINKKLYIPEIIIDLVDKYESEMMKLGVCYSEFIK